MKLDCVPKDFVRRRFVLAIFAIRSEMAYSRFSAINFISPQQSNAEQNPLVRTFIINTSNNTFTKLQLQVQRIKLHIEIINLKPVTPTTILLHGQVQPRTVYGHGLSRRRARESSAQVYGQPSIGSIVNARVDIYYLFCPGISYVTRAGLRPLNWLKP